MNKIDVVVGGDYGQGAFRFLVKMLYITNNDKIHESIQPVGYILCKIDNSIILKDTIIKNPGDSVNLLISIPCNIYVTGDLVLLVIVLGKDYTSPHWCIKCKAPSKY